MKLKLVKGQSVLNLWESEEEYIAGFLSIAHVLAASYGLYFVPSEDLNSFRIRHNEEVVDDVPESPKYVWIKSLKDNFYNCFEFETIEFERGMLKACEFFNCDVRDYVIGGIIVNGREILKVYDVYLKNCRREYFVHTEEDAQEDDLEYDIPDGN